MWWWWLTDWLNEYILTIEESEQGVRGCFTLWHSHNTWEKQGWRTGTCMWQLSLYVPKETYFTDTNLTWTSTPSSSLSDLWLELVTFQSQASYSNLHSANNPVWPLLWTTGLVYKYRCYKPRCTVWKGIDCNNMRQLLLDSLLRR